MIERLNVGTAAEMATRFPYELTIYNEGTKVIVYASKLGEACDIFLSAHPNKLIADIRLMSDNE